MREWGQKDVCTWVCRIAENRTLTLTEVLTETLRRPACPQVDQSRGLERPGDHRFTPRIGRVMDNGRAGVNCIYARGKFKKSENLSGFPG